MKKIVKKYSGPILFVLLVSFISFTIEINELQAGEMSNYTDTVKVPPTPFKRTTHPDAQWFPEAGLGLFIHWGISSVGGVGDLSWYMIAGNIGGGSDKKITPEQYWKYAEKFNPEKYDPDKWFQAAHAAGFRYVVLTSRHHDGFALWPSSSGDFSTKNYMGGRDLLKPYVEAARKNGLKVGFYYSPPDWHFNRDYTNFYQWWSEGGDPDPLPGKELDYRHHNINLVKPSDEFRKSYITHLSTQIEELLTSYGKIDLIWFDGGPVAISLDRIRELQPGIVINPRMHSKGDFITREDYGVMPDKRPQGWWEQCNAWNTGWGYTSDENYKPLATVLSEFVKTRTWGGNYLINVGPRPNGELPEMAYTRFHELEVWLKHSSESVFGTMPGEWPEKCNVPETSRPGKRYFHLLPGSPDTIIVKNAARPKQVRLLRTGSELKYSSEKGTLRITVPASQRTDLVDVVVVLTGGDK